MLKEGAFAEEAVKCGVADRCLPGNIAFQIHKFEQFSMAVVVNNPTLSLSSIPL